MVAGCDRRKGLLLLPIKEEVMQGSIKLAELWSGLESVWNSVFKFQLTDEEKKKSSTYRELLGIKKGLLVSADNLEGRSVLWNNDNWAASLIVRYGSMKSELHQLACEIMDVCKEKQIELKVE